nr:immunoglobulin heavy chain junction region [Mus musculus]MBK4197100.1 immunoglobulin heavy chain junction region [Mus musculus]
CARDDYGFDYW